MFFGKYRRTVRQLQERNKDIKRRSISTDRGKIDIFFIAQLTDMQSLAELVIRPIVLHVDREGSLTPEAAADSVLFAGDIQIQEDEAKIEENVLNGFTVVLFEHSKKFLIINLKRVEKKSVESPELSFTLRGPKDSLTENLDATLSLIRYRIKDPNLCLDFFTLGRRTKTRTAVLYIRDIANADFVRDIEDRMGKIDVDGIYESGELQSILLNDRKDLFPQMGILERSDAVAGALLEGKVVIVVEGSGLALAAPQTFQEFLSTSEDMYDNKYIALLKKLLRFGAVGISLLISSAYVAVVSFSSDIMEPEYALIIAKTRAAVPFNGFTEILLVELVVEIMYEALIRVPKQVGSAVGIVGALIIGQAAISAGIFSPLALIVGALSLLCSFVVPDYTIVNALRVLKFVLLAVTAVFGLYGLTLGMAMIVTAMAAQNSFGIPYLAPYAPFCGSDARKTVFYDKTYAYRRPRFLRTKDSTRIGTLPQGKKKKLFSGDKQ